eukprot:9463832-Pyramimonas_sp.AAC.1
MRIQPPGPSVQLPMRPRSAVLGGGNAREHRHWGLRWRSYGAMKRCTERGRRIHVHPQGPAVEFPMGPRSAVLGGGDACGRCHWGLRWSF